MAWFSVATITRRERTQYDAVPGQVPAERDVTQRPPHQAYDLRSFGRRRGRGLSPRQKGLWDEVLPQVALPLDAAGLGRPAGLFTPPATEVWLEIGFGGGEHLLWQAAHNPHVGLIGCEPFEDGVIKVLSAIAAEGLTNIRVHPDDGRPVLRGLPDASIGRAFILFPDPWPKKRHHKRRLLAPDTIADLARVLRRGSELRVGTDWGEYAAVILQVVLGSGAFAWTAERADDWRQRPSDWPQTRYEAKALQDGRRCYYFRFTKR
jgi:tRNA (guanine-N7-)-methyltransferase